MPDPTPAAPRRAPRDLLLGLVLLSLAAGGIVWFARRPVEAPARPPESEELLSGTLALRTGEIFAGRLRVVEPARLEIRIDLPAGSPAVIEASFGPPGPVEASPTDGPDAETAVRWSVKAGDAPRVETVFAYGLYVLRLEAPTRSDDAMTAAQTAHVRVRALPAR